jgi:drug/metabolite transporter (DMT)-like permease
MGQQDLQPENFTAGESQPAESLLRSMTQDIENLRQNLVGQLSQDIERLQREKSQLIEDIEKLKAQRQQHIVQQQQLLKQTAPALANQLQELLTQRLKQLADASGVSDQNAASGLPPNSTASNYNENTDRLIASLDTTLRTTFRTLQQDLRSYQSSLSEQLGQMHSLEQEGEAILETLVRRLREEFQSVSSAIKHAPPAPLAPPMPSPSSHYESFGYSDRNSSTVSYPSEPSVAVVGRISEPEPHTALPKPPAKPQQASKRLTGFLLVLLSLLVLSFEYIVVNVIFNKSPIFGQFELGGFISPGVGNSLLVLWLRMLIVVPLMAILATVLYPSVWRDIQQFAQSKDWFLFLKVLSSGFFLFLSQVLLYLAVGSISPGVAVSIFFIYHIFTVLLAWIIFGARLSLVRSLIIFSVLVGFIMLTLTSSKASALSAMGVSYAVGSAIAFAIYLILAQTAAKKLLPIPLSWINFAIVLTFSSLSLAGPLPVSWRLDIDRTMWSPLIVGSLVLGGSTLVSYLFNHIGIRKIDAARASLLGATVPALTALLGFAIVRNTLGLEQTFGMLLVTLGVAALGFERWHRQTRAARPAGRKSK